MRRYFLVVCLLLSALVQQSFASESVDIRGTWRLLAMEVEVQSTGEMRYPLGKNPTGYATFNDSRVWFVLTGEGRKPAKTAEEKAALFESLLAYSCKYRLEGDKWITSVDVAWNPAWIGTEQSRTFKVEGNHLKVITPWRVMPNWADKGMTRSINTFELVK
jgi:hypothetical protein